MANPGTISIPEGDGYQTIYSSNPQTYKVYRITNSGPGIMGVNFADETNTANSIEIKAGTSRDFLAYEIHIRNDGQGEVNGFYEAVT